MDNQRNSFNKEEIREIVCMVRLDLYNKGLPCGSKAIHRELDDLEIMPLPSLSTIGRILNHCGLTYCRTGHYE